MMKTIVTLLILVTLFSLNTFAQDSPQWHLPDGVKARLGKGWIHEIAYSPDGTRLALAGGIGIWLYDTATYQEVALLTGHTSWVRSVAFSPDGSTIATGSSDKTIRLWDADTGTHKNAITEYTSWVRSVAFSPDGRTIASGSGDGTVLLWELPLSASVNTKVSVSPSLVPSPAIGEQLTLSLNIADGENVAGYQATVQFDTSALRYVSSANGDYLPAGAFFVPPVVKENQVTLASTALAGVKHGDGTLATITFEVVAAKASRLTLSKVTLVNPDGKPTFPIVENGEVIEPPQIFGDVNRDSIVNIQDLVLVGSNFRQTGENRADVNGDGVVDIVDLVLVAGAIRNVATAPAAHPQAFAMLTAADVAGWLAQAEQRALTDATSQRGVIFLEQLLAALTPKETTLLPNYPNPFNPETWIPYHLAHAADVTLMIYDKKGTVVRQLNLGHQPAGFYTTRANAAYWNGRNAGGEWVASGVYFYQLRAEDYSALRRMVIVK